MKKLRPKHIVENTQVENAQSGFELQPLLFLEFSHLLLLLLIKNTKRNVGQEVNTIPQIG